MKKNIFLFLMIIILSVNASALTMAPFLKSLIDDVSFQEEVTSSGNSAVTTVMKAFFKGSALESKGAEPEEFYKKVVDQAEETGSLDEVQEILETKVKEGKATPAILFTLSMVYERKGMKREAYKALEKAEKEAKKHPQIAFNLALVYGRKEQLKTSLTGDTIIYHVPPGFALVKGKDFFIKKIEVTFAEYDEYCTKTGVSKPSDNGWGRGKNPVINVSWFDAVKYCNWLSKEKGLDLCYKIDGENVLCNFDKDGYRLPTEAEWEYAAERGSASNASAGWFLENSAGRPHMAGKLESNKLGVYDMGGNVWEWCWDWYPSSVDDSQDGKYKIVKGGSWSYSGEDITADTRGRLSPGDKNTNTGFRVVLNVR